MRFIVQWTESIKCPLSFQFLICHIRLLLDINRIIIYHIYYNMTFANCELSDLHRWHRKLGLTYCEFRD